MKYGVISIDQLCLDLHEWTHLYVAGRMQKPIKILKTNTSIQTATCCNIRHAVNSALLLLPCTTTEHALYLTIAGLSYFGDFRMQFGENPRKVHNIVDGNFQAFRTLYAPYLQQNPYIILSDDVQENDIISNVRILEIDTSPDARINLLQSLPRNLLTKMIKGNSTTASQYHNVFAKDVENKAMKKALANIVFTSSRSQSIKGIVTAGVVKSLSYVGQKLWKTYGRTPRGYNR